MSSIGMLSLKEIVSRVRAGHLSAVKVAEHFSSTIKAKRDMNAMIYFNEKQVLNDATQLDKAASTGQWRGPLHGAPIVVKDNIHMRGVPNTAGSPALANFVPKKDAPVVKSLRNAGVLFMGRTNMHEFAFGVTTDNGHYGPARNAHNPEYSAGGSSGGTGSAVGWRMAPAGLGTDTGGSVRIPSSVNGIAGLRPTLWRYSQAGVTPMSIMRDTIGPMAGCVDDLVLLDEVITEEKFDKPLDSLRNVRLGISTDYFCANLDPEIAAAFETAKQQLSRAGAILVEIVTPRIKEFNASCDISYLSLEMNRDLGQYLLDNNIELTLAEVAERLGSPDVKEIFKSVLNKGGYKWADYLELVHVKRAALKQEYGQTFEKNQLTALVFPTLPRLPIRIDEIAGNNNVIHDFIQNTDPGSQAGIPGLSIPMGKSKIGLPIGLEFDGLWNYDQKLLAIGLQAERVLPKI